MDFYFDDADRCELLEFILSDKGKLIPDLLYDDELYTEVFDCKSLETYLKQDISHYFLLNEQFYEEPLVLSKNRFLSEEKYYINQRKGGPYMDFSFYTGFANDSVVPFKRSIIELYPKFIHYNSNIEFKASVEVKAYYQKLTKYIKSKCRSINTRNKNYFVSKKVIDKIGLDWV